MKSSKDGDGPRFAFHAETTDRLLVMGSLGRIYTVQASQLPGGRGMGEPLRLMIDLPNDVEIVDILTYRPGGKLLVASTEGDGFIVPEDDVVAPPRAGPQVLNVKQGAAKVIHRVKGDTVAVVSENGRFLVFPVADLPEMGRGKGVRLQKYKRVFGKQGSLELDGGLGDVTTFDWDAGLSWTMGGGKTRTEADMSEWRAARGSVGRRAPHGFPKSNRFDPA